MHMDENKYSVPRREGEKFRAYDVRVEETELDEFAQNGDDCIRVQHATRQGAFSVVSGKGPKAYLEERQPEPYCGFSPDSDSRWRKIYDAIDRAITDLNEDAFGDFYRGTDNVRLEIPLNQLTDIDFAEEIIEFDGDTFQKVGLNNRKAWVCEMFEYIQERIKTSLFSDSPIGVKAGKIRDSLAKKICGRQDVGCRFEIKDNVLILTVSCSRPRNLRNNIDTGAIITDGVLSFGSSDVPADVDDFDAGSIADENRMNSQKRIGAYFEILKDRCLIAWKEHKLLKLDIPGLLNSEFRDFMRLVDKINDEEGFENAFRLQSGYMFDLISALELKWKSIFQTPKEIKKENVDIPMVGQVDVHVPLATKAAFDKFGADISKKVDVDGYTFLFTPISISDNDYMECRFFVITPDGFFYPRLAYKSKSGVRWRVSSSVKPGSSYGKGSLSYASETIPIEEVDNVLNELEGSVDRRRRSEDFECDSGSLSEVDTYYTEGIRKRLPSPRFYHLSDIDPNSALCNKADVDRFFASNSVPEDFIPDFSRDPISSCVRTDGVTIEKYKHNYHEVQLLFHMASDGKGRVWVDHIEEIGGKITSFGTRKSVLVCGPFSVKPYQYNHDIGGLNPDKVTQWTKDCYVYDPRAGDNLNIKKTFIVSNDPARPIDTVLADIGYDYSDITPLFDRLPLIQAYRNARGIERK